MKTTVNEQTGTFTIAAYSWPPPDSELDLAIRKLSHCPKLSLTNRVIADKDALNTLLSFVIFECNPSRKARGETLV